MRAIVRITAYAAITLVAIIVLFAAWYIGSKRGLPDVDALRAYAPARQVLVAPQSCNNQHRAVPGSDLPAIIPLLDSTGEQISNQIARHMLCNDPNPHSVRQLREIRLAVQMRVRLSTRDLQTIYLNQVYLGDGQYGIEDAAQYYYGEHASELTLSQAALLVAHSQSLAILAL
jgi:membrane carboxypeptidase/penicillin-binding protein